MIEGHCHFAEKCAYAHQKKSNSQNGYDDTVHDDVEKLKVEVDCLKVIIKSLMKNRKEEEVLVKSIKDMKEEIKILSASNKYIKKQIDLIEDDSDEESDSTVVNQSDEIEVQKNIVDFKCSKSDFVGIFHVTLMKHVNTKHALVLLESDDQDEDLFLDLFQMEVLEGEEVYACNICNEGFDTIDEVKKHISSDHKETLFQIKENIEEEEPISDESFGDLWLAKFDEDGNRLC